MQRMIAGIALAVCLTVSTPAVAATQWSENGHWYEAVFAPEGISWTAARDAAIEQGGYLATITSAEEDAFVYSLVDDDRFWILGNPDGPTYHIGGPWLGGYQPAGSAEPAGGWRWGTDEPLSYTNWYPGNPSNHGGIQDAMLFYGNGLGVGDRTPMWDDDYSGNSTVLGYVVEWEQVAVPEPSTLAMFIILGPCSLAYAWRRRKRAMRCL